MRALRIIRYVLWGTVAILGLFFGYQHFLAEPEAPQPQTLRMLPFAPPLPQIDYTAQLWTVVNFFASWCIPCRAEHPQLVNLARNHVVVGIAWKDQPTEAKVFLNEFGSPFIKVLHDPNGDLSRSWHIDGIPATFVVDAQGQIRYRRLGVLLEKHLTQINNLIAQ